MEKNKLDPDKIKSFKYLDIIPGKIYKRKNPYSFKREMVLCYNAQLETRDHDKYIMEKVPEFSLFRENFSPLGLSVKFIDDVCNYISMGDCFKCYIEPKDIIWEKNKNGITYKFNWSTATFIKNLTQAHIKNVERNIY